MTEQAERIDLDSPLAGDFQAVVRLIIGGIAERVDFAFEEIDDLQLAVERLLAEAGQEGSVHLSFEVAEDTIRARVGPLREGAIAEALRDAAVNPPGHAHPQAHPADGGRLVRRGAPPTTAAWWCGSRS